MKRYIKLILTCVFSLSLIVLIFFWLIKQDNAYVTYIKLQVNPSFIIGISNEKKVVFYNALNQDASKYNLLMFQGKSLDEATKVFIEKLGYSRENKDKIQLSIMTKNASLENEIYQIMQKTINDYDNSYKVLLIEPTNEDLEKYSSEMVYNLKRSLNDERLKEISRIINNEVDKDIQNKIKKLNISKLTNLKKREIIEEKINENYFNNFDLSSIKLNDENIKILKRSTYKVNFVFDNDNTYQYNLLLNIEFDYQEKRDKTIIEVYKFDYEQKDDIEVIRNLKNYYYSF